MLNMCFNLENCFLLDTIIVFKSYVNILIIILNVVILKKENKIKGKKFLNFITTI